MQDSKWLVVIPYVVSMYGDNVIEMALRGWLAHFREEFQLVVVGDVPECAALFPQVDFIPREQGRHPHINVVNAFLCALDRYGADRFIQSSDDIVPIRDFTTQQLSLCHNVYYPYMPSWDNSYYAVDMRKTWQMLIDEGIEPINYTCHMPHIYESDKFREIVKRYDLLNTPLDYECLYHNNHIQPSRGITEKENPIYVVCRANVASEYLKSKLESAFFVNFTNSALSSHYTIVHDYQNENKRRG